MKGSGQGHVYGREVKGERKMGRKWKRIKQKIERHY